MCSPVRARTLSWGERTFVMGIVNTTPDSFSGDGIVGTEAAIEHALAQHERGSDILDIGGESTRPGHQPVDDRTEMARVVPVISGVRERLPDALISVDTYKPAVLRACAAAGADVVNSVWLLPDALLDAALACDLGVVIMHNKRDAVYDGPVMDDVLEQLDEAAARAVKRGIARERIVLDPGIGFGKTADHNIEVLRELHRLVALGFPTLIGASRKSTLGKVTGREPRERVFATSAATALAIAAGIDVVRVHDVAEQRDVVRVCDAVVRDWRPSGWIA